MAISIHPLSGTRVTEDSSTDPKPANTTPVDAAAVEASAEGNSNEAGEGPVGYKPGEHRASGAALDRVNPKRSLELAKAAALVAAENGGTDLAVLDISKQTAIFDYFVIATGTSRRQLHAMSEEIDDKLEKDMGDQRMNIDGYAESRWIVLDYGTVVVHLFEEEARENYSLETLWADAKRIDLTELLRDIR